MTHEEKVIRNDAAKWREWVEVQTLVEEELPEGFYITMHCESQSWYLELCDPDGEEMRIDSYDSTADFFRTAVEFAKERARGES